jgi:hypothetical protein
MDGALHLLPRLIIYGPCIYPHRSFELKLVLYTANPWDNKDTLKDLLRHSDHALYFMYKIPVKGFWHGRDELPHSEEKRYLTKEEIG